MRRLNDVKLTSDSAMAADLRLASLLLYRWQDPHISSLPAFPIQRQNHPLFTYWNLRERLQGMTTSPALNGDEVLGALACPAIQRAKELTERREFWNDLTKPKSSEIVLQGEPISYFSAYRKLPDTRTLVAKDLKARNSLSSFGLRRISTTRCGATRVPCTGFARSTNRGNNAVAPGRT
jgi:hypothetical protein